MNTIEKKINYRSVFKYSFVLCLIIILGAGPLKSTASVDQTGSGTTSGGVTGSGTTSSGSTGSGTTSNGSTGSGTGSGGVTGSGTTSNTGGVSINTKIDNPLGSNITDLPTFINVIISFVLLVAIPIIVLAVIYAGFLFVTAAGNSEKLKKAKTTLLYTLIGAALLLGAFVIAKAIKGTVDCIGDNTACTQIKS